MNGEYFKDHIVTYLDILGYTDLVSFETISKDAEFIKELEQLILTIGEKTVNVIKDEEKDSNDSRKSFLTNFRKNFKIRADFDTLIIALDLSSFDGGEKQNAYRSYFFLLAKIIFTVIIKARRLVRGGIVKGPFYESSSGGSTFSFSNAWCEAAKLEKNAIYPRVLIDKEFTQTFIEGNIMRELSFLEEDFDGEMRFNFYALHLNLLHPYDDKTAIITIAMLGGDQNRYAKLVNEGYIDASGKITDNGRNILVVPEGMIENVKILINRGLLKVVADVKELIEEAFHNPEIRNNKKTYSKWVYYAKYHNECLESKKEQYFQYLKVDSKIWK